MRYVADVSACVLLAGVLPVGLASMLPHEMQPLECHAASASSAHSILLNVKRGFWCPVTIDVPATSLRRLTLAGGPRHGDVFTDGRRSLLYHSFENFSGEDSFSIEVQSANAVSTKPPPVMRIKVIVD